MKRRAAAVVLALATGAVPASPDWSRVASRTITLFHPGQASLEWVMNKADHSAASDIVETGRSCAKCHEGEARELGNAIVAGKRLGTSRTVLEPAPPAGKVGSTPVTVQAAHDGRRIYFRFEWAPAGTGAARMDDDNEVKLTLMFDGGGTVAGAELNGCWSTCHVDLRTMKAAIDDQKTKYVAGGDLAKGNFMDLIQFRSGKGAKPVDGHVSDARHMTGGRSLLKAEGRREGLSWVVVFERELAGKGPGDHTIAAGRVYNFGFAIHQDHGGARFHHVSLGYRFGLDRAMPDVKNYLNVVKQ